MVKYSNHQAALVTQDTCMVILAPLITPEVQSRAFASTTTSLVFSIVVYPSNTVGYSSCYPLRTGHLAPLYPQTTDHYWSTISPIDWRNASGYEEASYGVPKEPILCPLPHATMKKQSHLRLCIDSIAFAQWHPPPPTPRFRRASHMRQYKWMAMDGFGTLGNTAHALITGDTTSP
ncbi:hypothetical protein N7481_005373 [Penicillium waksmanii]|uniref:uncharacterized protein n=1 Tax=Penicillium waksmanii TaxID=69791 RepID=UPI002547B027|nr:uncharacterized protein N7481_005373 [Penicillium waksmanii]KAJ5983274.1 hypothetical protein N7481_005373 [Penicillium waksmanii]